MTAVKEASLTSGSSSALNSGAAARQLGAADRWTESVEERLSSCSQLLCTEASSDSTRLRIDYQSWQFNWGGWSAARVTSLKYCAQCSSRAQLALTVSSSEKKKNTAGERREITIIVTLPTFFHFCLSFLFPLLFQPFAIIFLLLFPQRMVEEMTASQMR